MKLRDLCHTPFFRILGFVLVALLFGYVFWKILANLDALRAYPWHLVPGFLVLGVLVLSATNFTASLVWLRILSASGERIAWSRAITAWILSRLGRYVPGKVWMFVGLVALVPEARRGVVLSTVGIHTVLDLLAGVTLAVMTFPALALGFRETVHLPPGWFLGGLIFVVALALNPRFIQWLLRKTSDRDIEIEWGYPQLVLWFLMLLGLWLLRILGHLLFIRGFGITVDYLALAAAFSASWLLGMISPFAPSGLGVREGLLTYLLQGVTAPGLAPIIAILTRLNSTIMDLVLGLPAWLMRSVLKMPSKDETSSQPSE